MREAVKLIPGMRDNLFVTNKTIRESSAAEWKGTMQGKHKSQVNDLEQANKHRKCYRTQVN